MHMTKSTLINTCILHVKMLVLLLQDQVTAIPDQIRAHTVSSTESHSGNPGVNVKAKTVQ